MTFLSWRELSRLQTFTKHPSTTYIPPQSVSSSTDHTEYTPSISALEELPFLGPQNAMETLFTTFGAELSLLCRSLMKPSAIAHSRNGQRVPKEGLRRLSSRSL